jgi:isoleucyl-tRNA synthetase
MEQLRELVTLGHSVRVAMKIKVRQPLAAAAIIGATEQFDYELKAILADELNVKAVRFEKAIPGGWHSAEAAPYTIALDSIITPELLEEGLLRELVRELQDLRKKGGCQPGQLVDFVYATDDEALKSTILNNAETLTQETSGRSLQQKAGESTVFDQTVTINGKSLWLGLANVE